MWNNLKILSSGLEHFMFHLLGADCTSGVLHASALVPAALSGLVRNTVCFKKSSFALFCFLLFFFYLLSAKFI